MRKLLLLSLAVLLFISCEKDSDHCGCIRTTYESEYVFYTIDKILQVDVVNTVLSEELIPFQNETSGSLGDNIYFKIECY